MSLILASLERHHGLSQLCYHIMVRQLDFLTRQWPGRSIAHTCMRSLPSIRLQTSHILGDLQSDLEKCKA